ncbi:sensor histidine kinase [Yinghuangia seranimata]|uniref:sensor histidine kinase n=1 Tax=Yinghuangia seranimata TaxID=408067 RepID=UPI00248AB477|nr:histidine kinase [Yinghuangia seranimata]MDI2125903.1 histidine kinase [Yinghuangia seranimata]
MSGVPGWVRGLRRPRRAWVVDGALGTAALAVGLVLLAATIADDDVDGGLTLICATGAASIAALVLFRRLAPVGLALVLIPAGLLSPAAAGASAAALFSVAAFRGARTAALVTGLHTGLVLVLFRIATDSWSEYWQASASFLFLDLVTLTSGMLVRSQRALVGSLEDRARQAEAEQRLRVEEARHLERERIAREMHDVLAHRLSLLAVHAGALEFRTGSSAEEALAAGVIRQSAHDAMEDLRDVIRMLRTDNASTAADGDADRPQPTLADLPALIEQSRRAGARVAYEGADDVGDLGARIGRHAYRIVQEGLTNARKHAPGEPVRVRLDVTLESGLAVEIVNPLRHGASDLPAPERTAAAGLPGAGAGLIGLRERVALVGGRLEHGQDADRFRLWAWLPWTA